MSSSFLGERLANFANESFGVGSTCRGAVSDALYKKTLNPEPKNALQPRSSLWGPTPEDAKIVLIDDPFASVDGPTGHAL